MSIPLNEKQLTRYENKVLTVLQEQNFILGEKEKRLINERIRNGRRYFFMVAIRIENGTKVERFVKIPVNSTKKLLLPFQRQIEFAQYVKEHNIIRTRGVVTSNIDPKKGIPFVIMETFPVSDAKIGFIEGNKGSELLTAKEAGSSIEEVYNIHDIKVANFPGNLKKLLKSYKLDYKGFRRQVLKFLNKPVIPLDTTSEKSEPFYQVLERRLSISGLKEKVISILNESKSIIDTLDQRIPSLVHGDMAPNNLYVFDSGDVELLDLEWVGICQNSALAMILDFGNLRARSWKNETFRRALDEELIKRYGQHGQEKLGMMIVKLSIIRSHLMLSGFFENYPWDKQNEKEQSIRRRVTEEDIRLVLS